MDDRYVWSRVVLGVMSLGFALVAGVAVLGSMVAMDPEDEIPQEWILVPAAAAFVGIALAALGGLLARIASGFFGLLTVVGGSWFLLQRPLQDWLQSRFDVGVAAILWAAIALGASALVLAIGVRWKREVGSEVPSRQSVQDVR